MNIPLDRLAALCPIRLRTGLDLLSPRQMSNLRRKIREAIKIAQRRNPASAGHHASTHPRARYWREYKRRQYKARKSASPASNSPIDSANPTCRTIA